MPLRAMRWQMPPLRSRRHRLSAQCAHLAALGPMVWLPVSVARLRVSNGCGYTLPAGCLC